MLRLLGRNLFSKPLPRLINRCSSKNVHNETLLPSQAEIVIAGGGVIGTSVAYHLTQLGWKDILLLEQGSVGGGTSWHAAGLCGSLRGTKNQTDMCMYGLKLYADFEKDVGIGWNQCGSLYLASTDDRVTDLKRSAVKAQEYGVDHEVLSADQIQKKHPHLRTDDIKFGLYLPNDGVVNPTDLVQAYLKKATENGSTKLVTDIQVKKVVSNGRRITSVETNKGDIKCNTFINCAGLWSRELGLKSSPPVDIPLHASEHFYIITKPIDTPSSAPVTRDLDERTYSREWSGGLLCGVFEVNGKPCFFDNVPEKFEFQLLQEDWDHFADAMESLIHRHPVLQNAEIRSFVNGPESFTPDCLPYAAKSIEFENYYVAAGMGSAGIASSAGIGRSISEMITHGSEEMPSCDLKRVPKGFNNKKLLHDSTVWALRAHYELKYPYLQNRECRNVMNSPLHSLLEKDNVRWYNVGNWEVPFYFKDQESETLYTFGKPSWLSNIQSEIVACEENIGIIDFSSKSKFNVLGPDALMLDTLLSSMCLYDISTMKAGDFIDNVLLSKQNGCQATFSLAKVNDNKYTFITSPEQHTYLHAGFIEAIGNNNSNIVIEDISGKYASVGLIGDHVESLLNELLSPPYTTENILPGTCRPVEIGHASKVQLVNQFMNGIKGWQLFIPSEYSQGLYRFLMEYGTKYNIQNIGLLALESIRVKYGIPVFGKELNSKSDPQLIKKLYGNEKIETETNLLSLEMTMPHHTNWPWGGEPIFINDQKIGNITSIGYQAQSDNKLNTLTITNRHVNNNGVKGIGQQLKVQCGGDFYEAIITNIF